MSRVGQKNDVFVGNIAFGTSEEDLRRIFSEVGRVKAVRMATNAETGKSRGYCFVEYEDAATALSAIRNLNNREINGRPLRVNFSNNSTLVDYAQSVGAGDTVAAQPTRQERTAQSVVESMSKREIWEVVKDAKELAEADRGRLRSLLDENPALVDGLVHAMLIIGMIKEGPPEPPQLETMAAAPAAVVQRSMTPPPPPQQFSAAPPTQPAFGRPPQPMYSVRPQPQRPVPYGAGAVPPPYAERPPPPRGFGYAHPPQSSVPPPELVNEALALSPHQLAQLPPDRRAKIEMLRDKFSRHPPPNYGPPPPRPSQPGAPPMGRGAGHMPAILPPRPRGVDLL